MMLSIVTLLVDGKAIQPSVFAVPEMNLSSSRSQMIKRTCFFSIEASEAIAFLEPTYEKWVAESREDDERCGAPQDELAEAGYPSLDLLLRAPQLLDLVVGHYLFRDLVAPLTWDGNSNIEYWLDEVTNCSLNGNVIEFTGICYSRH